MFNYGQSSQNLLKTLLSSACSKSYPKNSPGRLGFHQVNLPSLSGHIKPRTESFPEGLCNIAVEKYMFEGSTSCLQKVHKGESDNPHLNNLSFVNTVLFNT